MHLKNQVLGLGGTLWTRRLLSDVAVCADNLVGSVDFLSFTMCFCGRLAVPRHVVCVRTKLYRFLYIIYIYMYIYIYITSISIAVMAFPDDANLLTNYVYVDEQNEGLWSVEIA